MSGLNVKCVACFWSRQRQKDPLATIHQNGDNSWTIRYSNGDTGPAISGSESNDPRMCLCVAELIQARCG